MNSFDLSECVFLNDQDGFSSLQTSLLDKNPVSSSKTKCEKVTAIRFKNGYSLVHIPLDARPFDVSDYIDGRLKLIYI